MNNPREAVEMKTLNVSVTHTRGGTITKGFNVVGSRATYFIECDGVTIMRNTHDVVEGSIRPEGVSAMDARMMNDEWSRALTSEHCSKRVLEAMGVMDAFVARSVEPVFGNMMHEWPELFADTYAKAVTMFEKAYDGLARPNDIVKMAQLNDRLSALSVMYIHAEEGDWSFE